MDKGQQGEHLVTKHGRDVTPNVEPMPWWARVYWTLFALFWAAMFVGCLAGV